MPTSAELCGYAAQYWCEADNRPYPETPLAGASEHLRRFLGAGWKWVPHNGRLFAVSGEQVHSIEAVQRLCSRQPVRETTKNHSLCQLVHHWQKDTPLERNPLYRDDRILPSRIAMVRGDDRRAGGLFLPAAHTLDGQRILPGFEDPHFRGPALPLALYDLGTKQKRSWGRGAPLALRFFVEAILWTTLNDRECEAPIQFNVNLKWLLAQLYPGERRPRPSECLPRLIQACEALDSMEARVPWLDPVTGRTRLRRVVSIGDLPSGPARADDPVQVLINLPPGARSGPIVSQNLGVWGMRSAPAYRALLGLAWAWYQPGRTRTPIHRGKRRHWLQSSDPKRYPILTDDDLVRLCFPTSARRNRRQLLVAANAVIRQLQNEGELVVRPEGQARRILPPTGR